MVLNFFTAEIIAKRRNYFFINLVRMPCVCYIVKLMDCLIK